MKIEQWIKIFKKIKKHFPKNDIEFDEAEGKVWLVIPTSLTAFEAHKRLQNIDKFLLENNYDLPIALKWL